MTASSDESARLLNEEAQQQQHQDNNYGAIETQPDVRIRHNAALLQRTIFCASMFSLFGVMWGHFSSQIPVTKENLAIDDNQFGLLLLFDDLGSFIGQGLANRLPLLLTSTFLTPFIGISVVTSAGLTNLSKFSNQFGSSMLIFGTLASLFDIAINIQIVSLGRETKRADAPFFHGLFSAGQLTGSGLGTLLTHLSVPFDKRIIFTTLGMAIIFALHFPFLPKVRGTEQNSSQTVEEEQSNTPRELNGERTESQSTKTKIILLAAIGFLSSICEGSLSEWAGIYLRQNLNTSFVLANAAAFSYSIGMTIARLIGTWAARKAGIKTILIAGSLMTTISIFVGLAINQPKVFLICVGFAAMGLANITPLSMSILSQLPANKQALFVARVSLAQQIGFFGGPVLIGTLSGWLGLRLSLTALPVCSLAIAAWTIPLQILS